MAVWGKQQNVFRGADERRHASRARRHDISSPPRGYPPAMECRQLHNSAQEDAKALRALELGPASESEATSLVLSLASRIRQLQTAAASLPDAQRSMWDQRTGWAHQELTQLTSERVRDHATGSIDPDAVVRIIYACADALAVVEAGKAAAEAAMATETGARTVAEARAAELEESARGSEAASEAASVATRELLELRTKAVVQQQETQRKTQDLRDLTQRLQAVTKERDEMAAHLSRGPGAVGTSGGGGDANTAVSASSDLADAKAERDKLLEANHVLSVNLRQHGEVVEKLIGLNSELMDKANEERARRDPDVLAKQKELAGEEENTNTDAAGRLEPTDQTTNVKVDVEVDDEDEDETPEYDEDGNWIGKPRVGGLFSKMFGGRDGDEAGQLETEVAKAPRDAAALPV